MTQSHRDSIFVEDAEILSHQHFDGDQHILRIQAPDCARHAKPGQFAHLQVHELRPMRRPLSIMQVSAEQGWVDFLYKAVGEGTQLLSQRQVGASINLLGPIGKEFQIKSRIPLLIGGGVGMPPMIFLAQQLRRNAQTKPFVILGSEVPFPFQLQTSNIAMPNLPETVTATMPLLDSWEIPCRLASLQNYPGCHQGYVTDLARLWLQSLDQASLAQVQILSCGPHPMLHAVASLAEEFDLACQVSLEEYMACAVGGCAGCVVPVYTDQGKAMKRVCVDGPVFDSRQIFPVSPS